MRRPPATGGPFFRSAPYQLRRDSQRAGGMAFRSDATVIQSMSRSLRELSALLDGEFDPGSGRTLAACLMHASRTGAPSGVSGARLRNTWEHASMWGITPRNGALIPHTLACEGSRKAGNAQGEGPAAHQVVGGVTAYQADDG